MTHDYFIADVFFYSKHNLEALASNLSRCIGINLLLENSGRFEEVPAFVGTDGTINATLFGIPEDVEDGRCLLRLSHREPLSIDDIAQFKPGPLKSMFCKREKDSVGFINISEELSSLLKDQGFEDCEPS